jgi:hypothetical protein
MVPAMIQRNHLGLVLACALLAGCGPNYSDAVQACHSEREELELLIRQRDEFAQKMKRDEDELRAVTEVRIRLAERSGGDAAKPRADLQKSLARQSAGTRTILAAMDNRIAAAKKRVKRAEALRDSLAR